MAKRQNKFTLSSESKQCLARAAVYGGSTVFGFVSVFRGASAPEHSFLPYPLAVFLLSCLFLILVVLGMVAAWQFILGAAAGLFDLMAAQREAEQPEAKQ